MKTMKFLLSVSVLLLSFSLFAGKEGSVLQGKSYKDGKKTGIKQRKPAQAHLETLAAGYGRVGPPDLSGQDRNRWNTHMSIHWFSHEGNLCYLLKGKLYQEMRWGAISISCVKNDK